MISKDISLRALEIFDVIARTGSVALTAAELKLSLPAVSQQLRSLEHSIGRPLLDHSKRPMQLTAAGRMFRRRTAEALRQLRQGLAEASVLELSHLTQLRLGVIDDFDNHVTPELAAALAAALTDCEFRLHTEPSRELCAMAQRGDLDVAVAAAPDGGLVGLTEFPLLADPFVMIVPRGRPVERADPVGSLAALPLVRYDREQILGQRIEAELRRLRLAFPNRFELASNPAIVALVAQGSGWAVTTALSVLRSERFHDRIDMHPLPFAPFSRTISLFAAEDWIAGAAGDLAATFRRLVRSTVVGPARDRFPWLGEALAVIEA